MRGVKRGVARLLAFLVIQASILVTRAKPSPAQIAGAIVTTLGLFFWPWEHRANHGWTSGYSVGE